MSIRKTLPYEDVKPGLILTNGKALRLVLPDEDRSPGHGSEFVPYMALQVVQAKRKPKVRLSLLGWSSGPSYHCTRDSLRGWATATVPSEVKPLFDYLRSRYEAGDRPAEIPVADVLASHGWVVAHQVLCDIVAHMRGST
jgi:hypothetical protein